MIQELDVSEAFENLTISMIGAESETSNTRLPLIPRGQVLSNSTTVKLPIVFKFSNE